MSKFETDIEELENAIKDSNSESIINIITNSTKEERKKLKDSYYEKNESKITEDIIKILGNDCNNIVEALFSNPFEYDTDSLYKILKQSKNENSSEKVNNIIEILCSRTKKRLKNIQKRYKVKYHSDLNEDLLNFDSINKRNYLLLMKVRKF